MGGWVGPGDSVSSKNLLLLLLTFRPITSGSANMNLQWCPYVSWWGIYGSLDSLVNVTESQKPFILGGMS